MIGQGPAVDALWGLVGIPYRVGGRDLSGIDCAGLVAAGCSLLGLPWVDRWQEIRTAWERGDRVAALEAAAPPGWRRLPDGAPVRRGDVVVTTTAGVPSHVSLAVGPLDVLHAQGGSSSAVVRLRAFRGRIWAVYRCELEGAQC